MVLTFLWEILVDTTAPKTFFTETLHSCKPERFIIYILTEILGNSFVNGIPLTHLLLIVIHLSANCLLFRVTFDS